MAEVSKIWSVVRRIISGNVLHHVMKNCEYKVTIFNVHLITLDQFPLVRKKRRFVVGITKALKTHDVIATEHAR
jgi:hypothetical protein